MLFHDYFYTCNAPPQKTKKVGTDQRGSDRNGAWIGWHALITWFHSKYN